MHISSDKAFCPVHSIFRFLFFGQSDQNEKNQLSCLFIFSINKSTFCLKMTAAFFGFWSLGPKNEKRKEPDIFFYFFAENVNCQLKMWKHTSWVLYQIRILLKFRCSEKALKVWRNILLCFDVTEQDQNYEEDGGNFLWSSQNVTILYTNVSSVVEF